jgi:Zn-dependent membrane protease YugP
MSEAKFKEQSKLTKNVKDLGEAIAKVMTDMTGLTDQQKAAAAPGLTADYETLKKVVAQCTDKGGKPAEKTEEEGA